MDINEPRVAQFNAGTSFIGHIPARLWRLPRSPTASDPPTRDNAVLADRSSRPLDPEGVVAPDAMLVATDMPGSMNRHWPARHGSSSTALARAGVTDPNIIKA
ncbi:MAG: hypothetical protein ACRYGP_24320 [Janthinobacterium lividum]